MCEEYCQCLNPQQKKVHPKALTVLLLDCWQREYDQRPYKRFVFKIRDFEEKMDRHFQPIKDFRVIVQFLNHRKLDSVSMTGVNATSRLDLQICFANGLLNLQYLELRMMKLPDCFFDQLLANVNRMYLKEFILEGTPLSHIAIMDLRSFLVASKHLHYLNVSSCHLNQMNFAILADGVHKSVSLRRFVCNRIGGNSLSLDTHKFSHIISSLIWPNKLEQIDMKHCEMNAYDMEIISEYLWKTSSCLRELNIACNKIGSDGAEYLFRAISKSGTLTHLDLSCCGLGTHGGDVIALYLSDCFSLQHLNIRFNDIEPCAINNILTMFKKKVTLLSLKLCGNHFDAKSGQILDRLLRSRVVSRDSIDITTTYDEDLGYFRVIPYF